MNERSRHNSLLIPAVAVVLLALEVMGVPSAGAQQFMPNKYTDPATNEILEYNVVLPPGLADHRRRGDSRSSQQDREGGRSSR
jgi:hypothetical protein